MPRGGRSRGRSPVRSAPAPPKTMASSPAAFTQRSPVPVQQQQSAVAPSTGPSRGPGLLGQMAATAGGVAIGSTVGHVVGAAITGRDQDQQQPADVTYQEQPMQQQQYQQQQPGQTQGGACRYELQQFLNCAQNQHDITLCEGFNDALKQCKMSYGMQ